MLRLRRDPGPCPICSAPHTSCTAPPTGSIVAGSITPIVEITIPGPPSASASPEAAAPPSPTPEPQRFTAATYRGRKRATPPLHGG
jgi:hypothetical protein